MVTRIGVTTVIVVSAILASPAFSASNLGAHSEKLISAHKLATVRDISSIAVAPNGNLIAFQLVEPNIEDNTYEVSWHVVSSQPNSTPITIADGFKATLRTNYGGTLNGELLISDIVWAPDSKSLVFTAYENGEVQLWLSEIDAYETRKLTDNSADVSKPKFSADGSQLSFVTHRDRRAVDGIIESESRHGFLVQEPPIYDVSNGPRLPPCIRSGQQVGIDVNAKIACTQRVWVVETGSSIERRATEEEIDEYYAESTSKAGGALAPEISPDIKRLMEATSESVDNHAWFQNADPEKYRGYAPPYRVAAIIIGRNDVVECSFAECLTERPEKLWWNKDGDMVSFLVRDGYHHTMTSIYSWSPRENRIREILRTNDRLYDCEHRGERLICAHESWTSPRQLVSVDLHNGEMKSIFDPNPTFDDLLFTKVEKIAEVDSLGNETHAHLVYPHNYQIDQRYPLVIVQYRSSGFLRGGTGNEYPIHVLARYGFAVLSSDTPDDEYYSKVESDPIEAQAAYLRYLIVDRGPTTAIERIVERLDRRGIIDSSRVGITGLSQGIITLESALLAKDYGAASATYTLSPAIVFDQPEISSWGKAMSIVFGGSPLSDVGAKERQKYALSENTERINTPFLIQVADSEHKYTVQNYNALVEARKPIEMWIFPDEYHVKWQPAHRLNVYRRNLQWFQFWLQGIESDDPVDPEQYERWHKMRDKHCANMTEEDKKELPVYCEVA